MEAHLRSALDLIPRSDSQRTSLACPAVVFLLWGTALAFGVALILYIRYRGLTRESWPNDAVALAGVLATIGGSLFVAALVQGGGRNDESTNSPRSSATGEDCEGEVGRLLTAPPSAFPGLGSESELSVVLNPAPQPYETLRVMSFTKFPDSSTDWHDDLEVSAGEVVSFRIFYMADEGEALSTVARLNGEIDDSGTSATVTAAVWAANAPAVTDSVVVQLTGNGRMTGLRHTGYTVWNDGFGGQHRIPFSQPADQLLRSDGLLLGDTFGGGGHLRWVVARFCIEVADENR